MKKKVVYFALLALSIVSFFTSCKKETPDTDTQAAVDNAICQGEFSTIINSIISFGNNTTGIRSNWPTLTIDTTNLPYRTLIIDYGDDGKYDSIDGKYRKGKITARFYSRWGATNASVSAKLTNFSISNNGGNTYVKYSVDSILIARTAANKYSGAIIGGRAISSSWTLLWDCTYNFSQMAGSSTFDNFSDDVFSISGISKGRDRNGKTYLATNVANLIKSATCKWIEAGRDDITPTEGNVRTLDYGNGNCDNKVSLVINGNTFFFNLN
jgi:hypothetical protein